MFSFKVFTNWRKHLYVIKLIVQCIVNDSYGLIITFIMV